MTQSGENSPIKSSVIGSKAISRTSFDLISEASETVIESETFLKTRTAMVPEKITLNQDLAPLTEQPAIEYE